MKITANIMAYSPSEIAALLDIEGLGSVRVKLQKAYAPEGWIVEKSDGLHAVSGSAGEATIIAAVAAAMGALAGTIVPRKVR